MIILKFIFIQISISFAHHLSDLDLSVIESNIKAFQDKIKENPQNEAARSFIGFEKVASVPIPAPKDICFMTIEEQFYVSTLSIFNETDLMFSVFVADISNDTFELIYEQSVPKAISLSCRSIDSKGYAAVAFNLTTERIEHAHNGSPIYEIFNKSVSAVQYFGNSNLQSLQIMIRGTDMYLFHAYTNKDGLENLNCKYFKWFGFSFQIMGEIPCDNARRIAPFDVRGDLFIAIANYKDKDGYLATNSEIYKYNIELKKFQRFQKIKTYGAVDVKYFQIVVKNKEKQHFLVFANTVNSKNVRDMSNAESFIYKFEGSKFVPYQVLKVFGIHRFLPFNLGFDEFLLLASTSDRGLIAYQMLDWKFQDSKNQLTQDAFDRGVSSMRAFKTENETLLIVANENMMRNETNIFRPMFSEENSAAELRNEIIKWCEHALKRISHVNITDFKIKFKEAYKRNQTLKDVPEKVTNAHIKKIVTEKLIYEKKNFTDTHFKFLSNANEALRSIEERFLKLKQANDEFVTRKVSREVEMDEFDEIEVQNLIVHKNITFKNISFGQNQTTNFENLKARNVSVSGKLNGNEIIPLFTNSLRKSGIQIFNSQNSTLNIKNLSANRTATVTGIISGRNVTDLVRIDGGDYVIDQFVRFTEPLYVENLEVQERVNNIKVVNGQLDVLLKNSEKDQVITGLKIFDHVELREPVIIRGKTIGGILDEKKPVKHVSEDLVLNGDYILTGDVVIRSGLIGTNFFGESQNTSLNFVLENGLKLTDEVQVPMRFTKPITTKHLNTLFLNEYNVNDFVVQSSSKIQIVTGHKTFTGNLKIENGQFEANNLNGEDLKEFANNILHKNGDQEIKGNITFKNIITKGVNSTKLKIGETPFEKIFTKSTKQTIEIEDLSVDKLNVKQLRVQNFNSASKIFNKPVEKLFEDQFTKLYNIFELPDNVTKFNGIIYVKNLEVEENLNDQKIEDLQKQMEYLKKEIVLDYPVRFENEIKVKDLIIEESLNSVPVQELETTWLLNEGDQVFTYPQTFSKISIDDKIYLNGTLNNIKLENLVFGTYSLHKDEHLPHVFFRNTTILREGLRVNGLVNGYAFDRDVLLKNSEQPQFLQGPLIVKGNLEIKGTVSDLLQVNGVVLDVIDEYLNQTFDDITVEHAIFENPPQFKMCNGNDLKKDFMDYVWFSNVDVDMPYHVEFLETVFESPVDFKGPLNGRNIDHLKKMYFSKSTTQSIGTELKFTGEAKFESDFETENVYLYGPIVDRNGLILIRNFDEFQSTTLKVNDPQIIDGKWEIETAIVEGDLKNTKINDLILPKDLVRHDISWNYIDALKVFENVSIESLHPDPRSNLNGIDLSNWVNNAALSTENFTIKGPVMVDSILGYGDVIVHGTVNGQYITKDHILTNHDDQEIKGNVKLVTRNSEQIMSNTIHDLNTESINDLNIENFFENLVEIDDLKSRINIEGNLVFKENISANNFVCKIDADSEYNIWENDVNVDESEKVNELMRMLEFIEQQVQFTED